MNELLHGFWQISKPRIGLMVALTTAMGFFLGGGTSLSILIFTMIGTVVTCAGSAALNCYIERDSDRYMRRTMGRPLPAGRMAPEQALAYGALMVVAGVALLAWQVNLLTGFLALMTGFLYALVYTPLKRVTWLNTAIGAVPGALPTVGGWTAGAGTLDWGAWALFCILYVWQHPHFFAIAWLYREDYERAGLQMLPVVYKNSVYTAFPMLFLSLLLIPVSLLPCYMGLLGPRYYAGAFAAGLLMIGPAAIFWRSRNDKSARLMLRSSLVYLPALFLFTVMDS